MGDIYIDEFDEETKKKIKSIAALKGMTLKQAMVQAADDWVKKHK